MGFSTPVQFSATTFDYVIIGGGAAGLVLAGRLSEDSDVIVGVIEAGSDQSNNPLVKIPGLSTSLSGNRDLDWDFPTVPQEHTYGRVHSWPRGKGLGGSAMMNTMMYSNCSERDLNSWEKLGNKGWNWESMQPYYRKVETYNVPATELGEAMESSYIDPSLRGTDGPIQTTFVEGLSSWMEMDWIESCRNAGYPAPKDPRSGVSLGAFNQLMTIDPKTWTRSYSYIGYIEPYLSRPNLHIVTNARAGRILLRKDADGVVASGVQYFVGGNEYTVQASQEVICAAGTVQTPQVLELSGIGDRTILEKYGIDVVVENEFVGMNLQDHPLTGISYRVNDDVPTAEMTIRNPEIGAQVMELYTKHGKGPMTSGLTGVGFSSLHMVADDLNTEQVDSIIEKASNYQSTATRKQLEIQEDQLRDKNEALIQWITIAAGVDYSLFDSDKNAALAHSFPGGYATLLAVSTHMFSRGSIHIQSANPLAYPRIDPNYMSHPLDAEMMARAVLHARQLLRTEPLASNFQRDENGELIPIPGHNGDIHDPKTLEEAKEYVRRNCFTCYHPIGTASMLPREEGGVVNNELRVYGTKNLRVIDASIFPLHVQGNIMSLVYATAERGADIIKAARKRT